MELLIAGGIALLGYGMSAPGREMRKEHQRRHATTTTTVKLLGPANQYRARGNDTSAQTREFIAKAEKRWRDARDPAVTGVVTPHTKLTNARLPFFTSARKQHTSDAVKQTRLEMFTGANGMDTSLTGTYRNKQEVEAMFPVSQNAQAVTSSGSAGNQMYTRDDARLQNAPWQNNMLPADQIRVGRGIGAGPDVAATDGFHPMYRVMLKNVGEYKKNNLPGRTNHGASGITKATAPSRVAVNNSPGALVYDQERRPVLPTMASVLAPQIHPQLSQDPGMRPRPMNHDHFGNPTRAGHEVRDARETRYACGDDGDRNHSMPQLNVTGAAAGVGAFTHSQYDGARFQSQKRETQGRSGYVAGPTASQLPAGHLLPATQREMTAAAPAGGIGVIRSSGATRKMDAPKHTLRATQEVHGVLTGTRAAVQGGTMDNVWRYKRLGRDTAKRADQLVENTPGAARMNVQAGIEAIGHAAMRRDEVSMPSLFIPSMPNKQYQEATGQLTTTFNKLPVTNPRMDLGIASQQLRSNPYAKSLWEA